MIQAKVELLVWLYCTCNVCGREWVVTDEVRYQWDVMCCWSTRVREVPTQRLFCDEGGAWIRRPWIRGNW